MSAPFDVASRFARRGDGRFAGALDEGWYQGRGAYGGLVAAILARAIEAEHEEQRLRTLHVSFCAPATAGEAEVHVEPIRRGRSVSTARASMRRADETIASAVATLAKPRKDKLGYRARPMPPLRPPRTVADGPEALYLPAFCAHFELRQALGPAAFSGGAHAYVAGWCRPRVPTPPSAALVIALLDAWAPAIVATSNEWIGAASVDQTISLLAPLPRVADDAWYAFEARATYAADGYADEEASLFTEDGTPLASARQLIAIFG